MEKLDSLSIGERIATDAANVHRHFTFRDVISQAYLKGFIERFYGYVDDTAMILNSQDPIKIQIFEQVLNAVSPDEFTWTFQWSTTTLDFLDLTLLVSENRLHTYTYTKPGQNPQYLHCLSAHRKSQKTSIAKTEAMRFLVNNSTEAGFRADMQRLKNRLAVRGYPVSFFISPQYDVIKRENTIKRLASRPCNVNTITLHERRVFTGNSNTIDFKHIALKLPLGTTFQFFDVRAEVASLIKKLGIDKKPLVLNTISGSSFLRTYKLNFLYSPQ